MRAIAWLSLGLLLVARLYAQSAQPGRPSFAIDISLRDGNVMTVGSDVRVKIVLTNTSAKTIHIAREKKPEHGEEDGYLPEVRGSGGELAPLTPCGRVAIKHEYGADPCGTITSTPEFPVKPGETLEDGVIVTRLFKVEQPGSYAIQVSRLDRDSNVVVKSNTINVTVTQ
jgi:hypothetical protein